MTRPNTSKRMLAVAAAVALALFVSLTVGAQELGRRQSPVGEEQARATFREANQLYSSGRYQEAAERYEAILDGGFPNAEVHYNLGNALYMAGDIAGAVLNYERALRLDGSHEDAAANLEFVREQLADRQTAVGGTFSEVLDRFFRRADVGLVTVLTSLLYFVFIGCIVWGVLSGAFAPWLMRLMVVLLAGIVLAGGLLAYRVHRTTAVHEAIITAADVPVRTGPGDDFVLEFRLHEGTKVRMRELRDDWLRVSVEGTDLEGWLPASALEEI
jgi:hypothetical protein